MKKTWRPTAAIEPFRLITAALLSLLLPLSFLLLTLLSATSLPSSSLLSVLHFTIPVLLYAIVSSITISTLIYGLKSKITPSSSNLERLNPTFRPHLHLSWILLCVLQISVGLGIQMTSTVFNGVAELEIRKDRGNFSKFVFFLGLHETMLFWYRSVVKPVIDDTLNGDGYREESMAERAVLAVSCGTLWWWKLRDEIEALVSGNSVNDSNFEVVEFVNWWLYYLVVTTGVVRVVKGMMCVAIVLLFKRSGRNRSRIVSSQDRHEEDDDNDNKV